MTLLDTNHDHYFIETKPLNIEIEEIYDEHNDNIGHIKRIPNSKEISVLESDGKLLFTLKRGGEWLGPDYEMKDVDGNQVAEFKIKKGKAASKRKISMKSADKKHNLIARESGAGWQFEVIESDGSKVAGYAKLDHAFVPSELKLNIEKSFGLQVTNQSYERKFLVGFFVVLVDGIYEHFFEDWVEKWFGE